MTTAKPHKVMVDDNSHYMDETERYELGTYDTYDDALAACQRLVRADLERMFKPGMDGEQLYKLYTSFGEDPFVVSDRPPPENGFSAWKFAKQESQIIADGADLG